MACKNLYYGPAPSRRTISVEEIQQTCATIVNCREVTDRSHYYFPSKGERMDETIGVIDPDTNEETGETLRYIACPDNTDSQLKQVCEKIVRTILENGQSVYVHCFDGTSVCGPVVVLCMYWLSLGTMDPFDELRRNKAEFLLCSSKPQKTLVKSLYPYVKQRLYWMKLEPGNRKIQSIW